MYTRRKMYTKTKKEKKTIYLFSSIGYEKKTFWKSGKSSDPMSEIIFNDHQSKSDQNIY